MIQHLAKLGLMSDAIRDINMERVWRAKDAVAELGAAVGFLKNLHQYPMPQRTLPAEARLETAPRRRIQPEEKTDQKRRRAMKSACG